MQKKDLPQDPSVLDKFTRDLCYVVDESGKYTTDRSRGWEIKATALDLTWGDIDSRIQNAYRAFQDGSASPLLYYMELKLMDLSIVAAYTGFWEFQIKRHLKKETFEGLSDKKKNKYATLFEVSLDELNNPKPYVNKV